MSNIQVSGIYRHFYHELEKWPFKYHTSSAKMVFKNIIFMYNHKNNFYTVCESLDKPRTLLKLFS